MCATCGCSDHKGPTFTDLQTGKTIALENHVHHEDGHSHHHDHHHDHDHHHHEPSVVHLDVEILAKNNRLAEQNRGWFAGRRILALNLVSAPGAGKTTLLERTLADLRREFNFHVVEGDQATLNDARRIEATGCRVLQINTGTGCHLDAAMVARGIQTLDPAPGSVVVIENVGNLVCPALFDLGEWAKVLICSVTEGDDKPIKYPHMFRASSVVVLNKLDLLPHVPFDVGRFEEGLRQVNPRVPLLRASALRGDGLAQWYEWLRGQRAQQETAHS